MQISTGRVSEGNGRVRHEGMGNTRERDEKIGWVMVGRHVRVVGVSPWEGGKQEVAKSLQSHEPRAKPR
jgi:hypothetical protein